MKYLNYVLILLIFFSTTIIKAQEKIAQNNLTYCVGYIENKGQILNQNEHVNTDIKFLFNSINFKVQLKKNSFSYDTYIKEFIELTDVNAESGKQNNIQNIYYFHRVDIEFINANSNPVIEVFEPIEGHLNYFPKNSSGEGIQNIKSYNRIVYKDLYSNIDLEFVVNNNQPKYNFILHKGSNINDIQWKYKGANSTKIIDGKVQIELANGILMEDIPLSFYKNNKQEKVSIQYKKLGENHFSFSSTNILSSENTLVIDPVPEVLWATYLGGALENLPSAVCVDSDDNIYVSGRTESVANMTTSGAYHDTILGSYNGFYNKFNTNGQRLYGTIYTSIWNILDIHCDKLDNIIVSGMAMDDSSGTPGVFQPIRLDHPAGHIAKFNSQGSRKWATYFGAANYDYYFTIKSAIDKANEVVVTGKTTTTTTVFVTSGTYQSSLPYNPPHRNGYIAKLDTSGALIWGTFVASNDDIHTENITIDKNNEIIIAGYTDAMTLIGTPGVFMQNTIAQYIDDVGFIMKFSSTGQRLWGSYYGSTTIYGQMQREVPPKAIKADSSGNIYMVGETDVSYYNNLDTLGTTGVFQTGYGGGNTDGYIVKFNPNGTRAWASYYGGSSNDEIFGLAITDKNEAVIVGASKSTNNISSPNAFNTNKSGQEDGFIAKFNSTGQRIYGSYYGGTGSEQCKAVCIDSYGKIISLMNSTSTSYQTNSNSFQANSLSNGTYMTTHISKLSDCTLPDIPNLIASDTLVCPNEQTTISLSGQLNDATFWSLYQNDSILQSTTGTSFTINVNDSSSYYVRGTGGCVVKSNAAVIKIYFDTVPIVNAGADTSICEGNSFQLLASGNAVSYSWSNGIANGTSFIPASSQQLVLTGTSSGSCVATDTFQLNVYPLPQGVTYTNGFSQMCLYHPPRALYGGLPAGGYYSGSGVNNGIFYPDSVGNGNHQIIYVYTNSFGCSTSAVDHILVDPCIGIEENKENNKYKVYPNPTNSFLVFELEGLQEYKTLEIYNVLGCKIESNKLTSSNYILDVKGYVDGLYFYRITGNTYTTIQGNFVVKK